MTMRAGPDLSAGTSFLPIGTLIQSWSAFCWLVRVRSPVSRA
jgi:hypothetical protein